MIFANGKAISELVLTKDGFMRKRFTRTIGFPPGQDKMKLAFSKLLETLSPHKIFLKKLLRVRDLPEPLYTDNEWKVLKSTLLLLPDMAKTLRNVF